MAGKGFKWNGVVADHPLFSLYRHQDGKERPFVKASPKLRLLTPGFMELYFEVYERNEKDGDSFKEFLLLLWERELCRPDTEDEQNANYNRLVKYFNGEELYSLKAGVSSSKDITDYRKISSIGMDHTSADDVPETVQIALLAKRVKAVLTSLRKEDDSFPKLSGESKARSTSASASTSLSTGDALSMWKRLKNS